MAATNIHVLIIGAGISGLLLAQALKKQGIDFEIFESEDSASHLRPREWGMSIQWALQMLKDLLPDDLLDRLQSTSVDPHFRHPEIGNSMPVYNAATGELLKQIPLVKFMRASRRRLRALCAEGIDISYGKHLEALGSDGSGVHATFADGSVASGSLVVGADGANSMVRQLVFPDDKGQATQTPYGGVNMHVRYSSAETARAIRAFLSPIMAIGVHPKGYWLWISVQDVPDPEKPEDWVFQLQWTWKLDRASPALTMMHLVSLKEEASKSLADPFKAAWLAISEGTPVAQNRMSIWAPIEIPNNAHGGQVAFVGDAAHAMTFHRGQGLNHGIADVVQLTQQLADVQSGAKSQEEAVLDYQAEMIQRAGEEVKVSGLNTEMMHDWGQLKQSPFMHRGGDKNY